MADEAVYRRAIVLAKTLDHHLFDTPYHVVALVHGATPVKANAKYFKKAAGLSEIVCLGDIAMTTR